MAKDYMKDVEQYIKENISNYGLTLKKKLQLIFILTPVISVGYLNKRWGLHSKIM